MATFSSCSVDSFSWPAGFLCFSWPVPCLIQLWLFVYCNKSCNLPGYIKKVKWKVRKVVISAPIVIDSQYTIATIVVNKHITWRLLLYKTGKITLKHNKDASSFYSLSSSLKPWYKQRLARSPAAVANPRAGCSLCKLDPYASYKVKAPAVAQAQPWTLSTVFLDFLSSPTRTAKPCAELMMSEWEAQRHVAGDRVASLLHQIKQ